MGVYERLMFKEIQRKQKLEQMRIEKHINQPHYQQYVRHNSYL